MAASRTLLRMLSRAGGVQARSVHTASGVLRATGGAPRIEQLVDALSEPTPESRARLERKYADQLQRKLAEAGVATLEEYKAKVAATKAAAPQPARPTTSGTSKPSTAPPALNDILKLEKLVGETGTEILRLWAAFHEQKGGFVAGGITDAMYATFKQRARECPHFVFPMPRADGTEIYYGQFTPSKLGFTSLVEFQMHRENAPPHLVLDIYPDLAATKHVVLFRGQPDERRLSIDDGRLLVLQVLEFYVNSPDKYALVQTFNHRPREFDLNALVAAVSGP